MPLSMFTFPLNTFHFWSGIPLAVCSQSTFCCFCTVGFSRRKELFAFEKLGWLTSLLWLWGSNGI